MPAKNAFESLETALWPTFAAALATSRHGADVDKYFAYAVLELLHGVLAEEAGGFDIFYEDIRLDPAAPGGWSLAPRLAGHPPLADALAGPDLPAVLTRLSQAAAARLTAF
jgi:hypothetical protein